jgi:hypothetical protein
MDQAEILNSIVEALLHEPALVDDPEWDTFAAVASVMPEYIDLSAYRYSGESAGRPTPVDNTDLQLFRDLQHATEGPGGETWEICIVKVERDSARGSVNFVYPDEADLWRVDPANPRRLAENLRPQPADFA